jgi:hypothetical protein
MLSLLKERTGISRGARLSVDVMRERLDKSCGLARPVRVWVCVAVRDASYLNRNGSLERRAAKRRTVNNFVRNAVSFS